ncbi:hypothetical protein HDU76_009205 [Blyttiomyces sp. JEL0837]|nr:hypothetical protein HDU76_009205 [Blyttiomyces sp. JEL0837]
MERSETFNQYIDLALGTLEGNHLQQHMESIANHCEDIMSHGGEMEELMKLDEIIEATEDWATQPGFRRIVAVGEVLGNSYGARFHS